MASLDLAQLQAIIDNASKSEAKTKELRRVINRATAALENLSTIFGDISSILDDNYEASETTRAPRAKRDRGPVDADAPYGRKKDGTPRSKPGRGAGAGESTAELDLASGGNVLTGRTADEAEPAAAQSAPAAKKEKAK